MIHCLITNEGGDGKVTLRGKEKFADIQATENHRDTADTEIAQRRKISVLPLCSLRLCGERFSSLTFYYYPDENAV